MTADLFNTNRQSGGDGHKKEELPVNQTAATVISCPHCGREIALDQALSHKIRQQLQKEIDAESAKRKAELKQVELRLQQEKSLIEKQRKDLEEETAKRIETERAKLRNDLKKELEERSDLELAALKEQLQVKEQKISAFRQTELALRKEKSDLEEARKSLELEVARRMDNEKRRVQEETERRLAEQFRLKEAEKDKIIDDLKRQAEEFKRKADQGSQQLQGEVAELSLEEMLRSSFPIDSIDEVPKGIRGADVIHRVSNRMGQSCGTLIWESKRTKAWSDGWIDKLKEDQREVKAEVAVLVSSVLPKEIKGFGLVNGVWVCDHSLAVCLAQALRSGLVEVTAARLSSIGKSEKMEVLYEYLSGQEFRQQVEAIVEAFTGMRRDLDQERRAMEKIWAKREKQIERVIKNMGRMYGSMQGVIGQSMPELGLFELKALSETDDKDE
jgi:hypothetical protein